MKTKLLFLLLAAGLLVSAAWFVQLPGPVQAYDVPEKYRETVRKGLEYLVKNQHPDGHWEGDGGKHPVAMTGLVGLALLMEQDIRYQHGLGEAIPPPKHAAEIRKAADWLMAKADARRDGLLFSEHDSEAGRYMQGHGLATLFLAGVCVNEKRAGRSEKLAETLARAVKYLDSARSTQGGWYRTSKAEGHDFDEIQTTALQMQALQAVEIAGIPVPVETINDGREYLKREIRKLEEKVDPAKKLSRQTDTAAALISIFNEEENFRLNDILHLDGKNRDRGEDWFKYCRTEIPVGPAIRFGRDELTHYWFAQVMFDRGGETWNTYRTAMFDHLQTSQNKDGSWPASEGIGVGPVYSTALWCVVLQLDKQCHPARRRAPVNVR